ncbi:MAG: heat-inducible transcriptional repressor HrcA [Thermoanaerobaculales bacterium]|nr:heat-inducible transcriptional repressor HrcA [Thermoanaerobaculales bacterium]
MELSKRALSVLCAIVELYIRSGEPVASQRVARHSRLGLSSATIRSVMAELEEGGYLTRLHSSAGRVPSDAAFRLYVDNLPQRCVPPPAVREALAAEMLRMRRELIEDIDWVAQLIAQATNEAGVSVRPLGEGPVLEAVSLVLLEHRGVLGLVVGSDGSVEKKLLELDERFSRDNLQQLSNFMTRRLAGAPLQDIGEFLSRLRQGDEPGPDDELLSSARAVVMQLSPTLEGDIEVRIAGTENLLVSADFSEIERVRSLLSTLEDRTRIAAEFRRAFTRGRTQVLIGGESETTAQGDLGIVATLYFRDRQQVGAVGVVGPRRMDYQRIVPVVEYIGDSLTQMLETSGADYA